MKQTNNYFFWQLSISINLSKLLTVFSVNSKYKLMNVFSVQVPNDFDFSSTLIYGECIL